MATDNNSSRDPNHENHIFLKECASRNGLTLLELLPLLHTIEENQTQKSSEHSVDSIFHQVVLVYEQSFKVEPDPRVVGEPLGPGPLTSM